MELGVFSFVDRLANAAGEKINARLRVKNLLEEATLADQAGLDVYGVGEHHRHEFVASSPATLLAAIAALTKQIRLTSAVTVLSSDDPVRVFQQFATLDLISDGRSEIMAGRGSFTESFPLFGYSLHDYDELFEEKLELLLKIIQNDKIFWKGKHRPALHDLPVYPRPVQNPLPVWIAVGGTPESAIRAAQLALPMAVAIIGGMPEQFIPLIQLYRKHWKLNGHSKKETVSINSITYVADSSQKAREEFYELYSTVMNTIGKERGWQPLTKPQYDQLCSLRSALVVGSPQEVIDKILFQHELFGHNRFMAQIGIGFLTHKQIMHAIDLFGNKVAPAIRKAIPS